MLEVKHLTVEYGGMQALQDVSLRADAGEWVMITGPNGAGKSTLLGAMMQSVPYTGEVLLDGANVKTLKPRERAHRMGMLSQQVSQGYAFTVEEIVRLGRYAWHDALGGLSAADEAAAEHAMCSTGTATLRHKPISQISGGEVQRAFLAQLFAQNPRFMLLDEPLSHLDVSYQKQIFELIGQWLGQGPRTVLSVVHDLSVVRRFATRVILMDHGRIAADGPPEEALAPDVLTRVYGMDAAAWMRELYGLWGG